MIHSCSDSSLCYWIFALLSKRAHLAKESRALRWTC